jgi:hypothetical protein
MIRITLDLDYLAIFDMDEYSAFTMARPARGFDNLGSGVLYQF